MLSFITHKFFLFNKQEIWFYKGEEVNESAYTAYCYTQKDLPRFDHCLTESTVTIDLTKTEEELFNSINTTFRYHIRKAKTLNTEYVVSLKPTASECLLLIHSFRFFAKEKKIRPMNKGRIMALQRKGNIIITGIRSTEAVIIQHVYLFDEQRIILLHTFHVKNDIDNNNRSYMNKYLHWRDILLFKQMNLKVYDFGGIDLEKVPGITKFKLSYGGNIETVNNYIRIKPLLKPIFKLYKTIRLNG